MRFSRRGLAALMVVALAGVVAVADAERAEAAVGLPAGFSDTLMISGLEQPTSLRVGPDGRVWVGEKSGLVKVFPSLTNPTATEAADLRVATFNFWDRGLMGLAVDSQLQTGRPYVYITYAYDHILGAPGGAPRWGSADPNASTYDDCPDPPGAVGDGCVTSSRVSRFTVSGNGTGSTLSNEVVLVEDWCMQFPSHSIGGVDIGPDGMLYVSGGEGASFDNVDYGQFGGSPGSPTPRNPCGDPPGGVGGSMTAPTARGGTLRAQSPRRPAGEPRTLDGTLIRIHPDTGAGVSGNPFFGSTDANARRIIAYGMKNPFRWTFRPGTSEVWLGDVGIEAWEEIDRVTGPGAPVENFGFPCYQGSGRDLNYQAAGLDLCSSLYAAEGGANAATAPHFAYDHSNQVVPTDNGQCPTGVNPGDYVNSAISGLAFYTGGNYPAKYQNALFFADYARSCIWAMLPGPDGTPDPTKVESFALRSNIPVDLMTEPGTGNLLYLDIGFGNPAGGGVHRVSFAGGGAPTARITTTPDPPAGGVPLAVNFSGSTSTDPEGQTLTYSWTFGDGGTATGVAPSHTYTAPGQHTATLTVRDPGGLQGQASVLVQVGAPTPTITAPATSLTWSVGDDVAYAGSAVDTFGTPLPESALSWKFYVRHCTAPTVCHSHDLGGEDGTDSGTISAPSHPYPSDLRFELTATDNGTSTTVIREIEPNATTIQLVSNPTGLQLGAGAGEEPQAAPWTKTVIVGTSNTVSAPPTQTLGGTTYTFSSWSDGGAATHTVTSNAPLTLTANYTAVPGTSVPPPSAGGWTLNGSSVMSGSSLVLTPSSANKTGTAFWPSAVSTGSGISASFDVTIDQLGPSGGDGMALLFMSPSEGPTALGFGGSGLGFAGKSVTAVVIDQYQNGAPEPSANFVGIATSGLWQWVNWQQTSTAVPVFANATRHVDVTYAAGHLIVKVDGVQKIDRVLTLPSNVLVGFSGATGGGFERHAVSNVAITVGQPTAPVLSVAPTAFTFPGTVVGTSAPTQAVTVSNTGTAPLTISSITGPAAPFSVTGLTAGQVIAPAASAIAQVGFAPTAAGAASGSFTINTNGGNASVALTGTGTAPVLSMSPATVAFGPVNVGSSAPTQAVTVSNTGTAPLTIGSVTAPAAPFSATGLPTAGQVIAAGASVTVTVGFSPTAAGPFAGSLAITSDGGNKSVALTGTGAAPVLSMSPATVSFGNVAVGSSAPTQAVTVSNTGDAPLTIGSVTAPAAPFSATGLPTAGQVIAAGASVTVTVGFSPTAVGPFSDSLAITSDGGNKSVSLTGTGTAPVLSMSPATVAFGPVNVGSSAPTQSVTVSNTGTAPLTIGSVTAPAAPFSATGLPTAGQVIAAGASVTVTVGFSPTAVGPFSDSLAITSDGGNATVALSGTGQPTPVLTVSPATVAFGPVNVGSSAPTQEVTISNTGDAPLTIGSVTAPTAPFSATGLPTAGQVIAAGASVTVTVGFSPTAAGPFSSSLAITSDGGNKSVSLTGTGTAPVLSMSPATVSFGNVAVGSSAPTQSVTISNTGAAPLTIGSVTAPAAPFSATGLPTAGQVIAAGASVTVTVGFSPTAAGPFSDSLAITSDGGNASAALTGTGTAPVLSMSPASVAFGPVNVGSSAPTQSVTISNTGNAPLTVGSVTAPAAPFSATGLPTAGQVIAAGASIVANVGFSPTATGPFTGSLAITSNGGNKSVSLSGTGAAAPAPVLSMTPASVLFGNVAVGSSAPTQAVTVSNTGTAPLTIATVTAPATPFSATGLPTAGQVIAAGASVTVTVGFSPTAAGPFSGSLAITSNGGNQSVSLSGTGVPTAPVLSMTPATVSFGNVAVGSSATTQAVTVSNTGTAPLTIGSVTAPAAPFSATGLPTAGQVIAAGASVTVTVGFSPTAAGPFSSSLAITSNGGNQSVSLTGTGTSGTSVPPPSAGGWTLNGSSVMSGSSLVLTPSSANKTGTAFWPSAVSTGSGISASFDVTIDQLGPSGGDGMALLFMSPSEGPTALGFGGSGLGFAGKSVTAVVIDQYQNGAPEPSANFVGIATSGLWQWVNWQQTSTAVPVFANATRHVDVTYAAGHLIVKVDGVQKIDRVLTLPSNVLVGFSGATGGGFERHAVSNVAITVG